MVGVVGSCPTSVILPEISTRLEVTSPWLVIVVVVWSVVSVAVLLSFWVVVVSVVV